MTRYKKIKFTKKLQNAFNGVKIGFWEENNIRNQVLIFFLVLSASLYFRISKIEFLVLILTSAIVFLAEYLNTSIENLCDHVTTEEHYQIKRVKDISAGSVFIVATLALLVGIIIFSPYLYYYL